MSNPLANARFLTSAAAVRDFPPADAPEVAFAGRSNAGKSSALNALAGRRGLARTSKAPGRTQLINFFELHGGGRLADLPGYGFAKVPERVRRNWRALIEGYLAQRPNVRGAVLLMDARHPLKEFDWQMLAWAAHIELDCHILLTKADKLGRGARHSTLLQVQKALETRAAPVSVQLFSATAPLGAAEAIARIGSWLS
jgi:GTP-binding protein